MLTAKNAARFTVKVTSEFSGYSIQYLVRILRTGELEGVKMGNDHDFLLGIGHIRELNQREP